MNTDLLRKVQVHILSNPNGFDMDFWYEPKTKPRGSIFGFDLGIARCGTVACIAGWTCVLAGGDISAIEEDSISTLATDVLGLTDEQADALFYPNDWPPDLAARYQLARSSKNHELMARVASDAIDRFIEDPDGFAVSDQGANEPDTCNIKDSEQSLEMAGVLL